MRAEMARVSNVSGPGDDAPRWQAVVTVELQGRRGEFAFYFNKEPTKDDLLAKLKQAEGSLARRMGGGDGAGQAAVAAGGEVGRGFQGHERGAAAGTN